MNNNFTVTVSQLMKFMHFFPFFIQQFWTVTCEFYYILCTGLADNQIFVGNSSVPLMSHSKRQHMITYWLQKDEAAYSTFCELKINYKLSGVIHMKMTMTLA
jgi:hypothetical protein